MKTKLILIGIAIFICSACEAQSKNDNAIIIKNTTAGQIRQVLFNSGFMVTSNDTAFITTDATQFFPFNIKLSLMKTDTAYILRGWAQDVEQVKLFKEEDIKSGFYVVTNNGMKGGIGQNAWQVLVKIAKSLTNDIVYAKL